MNTISLDEMLSSVKEAEQLTYESEFTQKKLREASKLLCDVGNSNASVTVFTDYDADGICSAHIIEKTLKALNPDIDIDVIVNDRRGSYGVPKDIVPEPDRQYIVLDMGSNELPYILKNLGEDTIIIDHHIIEEEKGREFFNKFPNALNLHSFRPDQDELNPQYCTTGLAYRLYEETVLLEARKNSEACYRLQEEKLKNEMGIIAAIGTAADMVDVLDKFSYNRQILKEGVKLVNEADENSISNHLGTFLTTAGIGLEDVTARILAFNVGSFINAASRMSEVIGENGGQLMYDTLSEKYTPRQTGRMLEYFSDLNRQRKDMVNEIQQSSEYRKFVSAHRFGDLLEEGVGTIGKIAVYKAPEGTPHAFCGLIAGKLAEAIDKPVICVVEKDGAYSGSGRNREGSTSLFEHIHAVMDDTRITQLLDEEHTAKYGGHTDAIGISHIDKNVFEMFEKILPEYDDKFETTDLSKTTVLDMSIKELLSEESKEKLLALEPIGTGLQLPLIEIEGKQTYAKNVKDREDWFSFGIGGVKGSKISNWCYDQAQNILDAEGNIKCLAEISISNYGKDGLHPEFTQKWNEEHYALRIKEVVSQQKEKQRPINAHEM